jgi:predicted TPR repeat methyltransferase
MTVHLDDLLKKGISRHKAGKFIDARNYYLKILKKRKDHLDALYLLGTLYGEHKKTAEATRCLEKASQLKPDSPMILNNLGNAYRDGGDLDRAKECYLRALALNPDLPQAHYNLGLILEKQNADKVEIMQCYQKALSLDPRLAGPNRQLGIACLESGNRSEAVSRLRIALQQKPDDVVARYFLSIAEGKLPDKDTRTEFVKDLFDHYSADFDTHLVERLQYNVPAVARETLEKIFGNDLKFQNMVDLGCGTGLSGIAFRDCTEQMVGIDLSGEMLDRASGRKVYNTLLQGDISQVLDVLEQKFDFFLATDVVIYFQDLTGLFASIRDKAAREALLVFSTERYEGEGFAVTPTGRTAHSFDYIRTVAESFQFRIMEHLTIPIRKEKEGWIEGELYLLKLVE